jgi:hypothetical protein
MAAIASSIRVQSKASLSSELMPGSGATQISMACSASASARARISSLPQASFSTSARLSSRWTVAVDLLLALEGVVAQRTVEGGEREVPECVHELPVDGVRFLAELAQVLAPLGRKCLRQHMLDLEVRLLEVDLLRMLEALLQALEDQLALLPASDVEEGLCTQCLAKPLVARPVEPVAREFAMEGVGEALVFR